MRNIRTSRFFLPAFFGVILTAFAAGDVKAGLLVQEPWSNVFGGKEAVFHVQVADLKSPGGTVTWQFAIAGHTVSRGEQAIERVPGTVEIKLAVPPVKDGVIMQASLTVEFAGVGIEHASVVRPLYVFSANPFTDKAEWLKKLNINLFDPAGKTAELFTKYAIPFTAVSNIDALPDGKERVVIVGEGASFRDYRGLAGILVKTAAAGVPVLCLAPAEGDMRLPGSEGNDQPFPADISLRQNEVITQLDKRLDRDGWAPDGKIISRPVALRGDREGVSLAVADAPDGWPWVDLRFPSGRGRLILCGFALVEKWEGSPAPRFLLERILNDMAKDQAKDSPHDSQK